MNFKHLAAVGLLVAGLAACSGNGTATPVVTSPSAASAASAPAASGSSPVAAPPASSAAPSAPSASASGGTPIVVKDFTIDPKDVTAAGTVSLAVTNAGPTVHNLSIRGTGDEVVGKTRDLKAGESETLTVELPAGTYVLFCSLPGHESLGMKGTLTVVG